MLILASVLMMGPRETARAHGSGAVVWAQLWGEMAGAPKGMACSSLQQGQRSGKLNRPTVRCVRSTRACVDQSPGPFSQLA